MTDSASDVRPLPEPEPDSQVGMAALFDLSSPQPRYRDLLARGGFMQPMDQVALSFARESPTTCCVTTSSSRHGSR